MTERLYFLSDATEGRARVIRCESTPDGRYAIELDQTLFHPQGGGQPADGGSIAGILVESLVQEDHRLLHLLAQPLHEGEVVLRVDATLRRLHSRWHSAGHLIGYAGEELGWRPVKAHHWPGEGRVVFTADAGTPVPEAGMLIEKIQRWQTENLTRHVEVSEGRRKVGFGDLPAWLCGGTHVGALADVGVMTLSSIKLKKGQLTVSYALK